MMTVAVTHATRNSLDWTELHAMQSTEDAWMQLKPERKEEARIYGP